MRHGYTNQTDRVVEGVRKSYEGPDARVRAEAEFTALARLGGEMPVAQVIARTGGSLITEFMPGQHGQDLIDAGHGDQVLWACGALLRRLHDLSPVLLESGEHPVSHKIRHGDFGPNNVLLDPRDYTVTALLDWEFSGIGPAIQDLAWCEWIVRMHHPGSVASLTALFEAYGERPSWSDRQTAMVERCRWLEVFTRTVETQGRRRGRMASARPNHRAMD